MFYKFDKNFTVYSTIKNSMKILALKSFIKINNKKNMREENNGLTFK